MNVRAARMMTQGLGAICAVLLLLLIAQYAGLGRGYGWGSAAAVDDAPHPLPNIDRQAPQMPPAGAFAAIDAHPLFNVDRQPSPVDDAADAGEAPPANPLNVQLTGVIIDDARHVRVAMLLDKARNVPVSLKVGMPLEGDQAAWTLVELKPRVAVFRNATAETTEVELETASSAAKAPGNASSRNGSGRSGTPAHPAATPPPARAGGSDNASDLARRIEERRRQMREEAEKNRKGIPAPAPHKK